MNAISQSHCVPVSESTLVRRVNRRLDRDGQRLFVNRVGCRAELQLGRYYILDTSLRIADATHCDLEDLAREVGALKAYERLEG